MRATEMSELWRTDKDGQIILALNILPVVTEKVQKLLGHHYDERRDKI